jgi:hypothetical protein
MRDIIKIRSARQSRDRDPGHASPPPNPTCKFTAQTSSNPKLVAVRDPMAVWLTNKKDSTLRAEQQMQAQNWAEHTRGAQYKARHTPEAREEFRMEFGAALCALAQVDKMREAGLIGPEKPEERLETCNQWQCALPQPKQGCQSVERLGHTELGGRLLPPTSTKCHPSSPNPRPQVSAPTRSGACPLQNDDRSPLQKERRLGAP